MTDFERESVKNTLTLLGTTVTAAFVWLYLALVLLLGRHVGSVYIGPHLIAASTIVAGAASLLVGRAVIVRGRSASKQLLSLSLALFCSFGCLFVMDVLYSLYLNSRALGRPVISDSRLFDPASSPGELLPHLYYPTDANFRLHKASVSISGSPYGTYYSPELSESSTLDSVFTLHPFSYTIDEHGFRNTMRLDQADIFALGDSYTFGWAVDAQLSWIGRLQDSLHRPVYNLGIHDSSPKQELELLKYVLRTEGNSVRIRTLLWMIYEGNDLEDSYAESAPVKAGQPEVWETLTEGTILQHVNTLPWLVRKQSIINKILSGDIRLGRPTAKATHADPTVIDGVRSWYPMYRSRTLGPRLFSPIHIERAGKPASYVLSHRNRPRLDDVFEEMARLADEYSFHVTVIIAPTAVRLYGPLYDEFPPISDEPHFIDYVAALSDRTGFQAVDLLPLLRPYASGTLLYFKDDGHWNARGHAVVAEIIRQAVFQ